MLYGSLLIALMFGCHRELVGLWREEAGSRHRNPDVLAMLHVIAAVGAGVIFGISSWISTLSSSYDTPNVAIGLVVTWVAIIQFRR